MKDRMQPTQDLAGPQHVAELFRLGRRHEMRHELVPARRFFEQAMAAAKAGGRTEMVMEVHAFLGIVSLKENNLGSARIHLETALAMAIAAENAQLEAYTRQETGFLLLGEGKPEAAGGEFLRVLGLAPSVGIVNLTGNGLSGLGVAFLALGRTSEAVPLLLGALGIRTEIGDLEQQHVDLVHLAHAAVLLDQKMVAGAVAGFLASSPETRLGMYAHDRRTFDLVTAAVGTNQAAAGFDEARLLVASLTTIEDPR
ncbi:hypothetical protein [Kribbella sp. NPDC004536]|uniref:hypothetical protein n=1 Tax=Kribbella sp. NPDC004536 TaxID=3364106 RepID=UPI0036CE57F9